MVSEQQMKAVHKSFRPRPGIQALDPLRAIPAVIRRKLKERVVTEEQMARLDMLQELLEQRAERL